MEYKKIEYPLWTGMPGFYLCNITKANKLPQNIPKWVLNMPNGRKQDQIGVCKKYQIGHKIYQHLPLQIGIIGLKIYHLATLAVAQQKCEGKINM
jgi:hypothetical protein